MKRIDVTPEIEHALSAIAAAESAFVPGRDSSSVVEIPKLALAEAVLKQIQVARAECLQRLPRRAPVVPVVEVEIRPKRRRA